MPKTTTPQPYRRQRSDGASEPVLPPLITIRALYGSLTPTEQRIADAILADPQRIVYASITEAAVQAGTAESSIIRFCRRIGCRGYHELKLALAQELVTHRTELTGPVTDADSVPELLAKVEQRHAAILRDTLAVVDAAVFKEVVDKLCGARQIMFFGAGESGVVALQAQYRFARIGLPVLGIADTHLAAMQASMLGPDDVACAISASGSSRDTTENLAVAHEQGAFCVAITGQARSPVCTNADAVLLVAAREGPLSGTGFLSSVGTGLILDALLTAAIVRDEQQALTHVRRTSAAVTNKLY